MIVKQPERESQKIVNTRLFVNAWRPIDGWLVQELDKTFVLPTHHSKLSLLFYNAYKARVLKSAVYLILSIISICVFFIYRATLPPNEYIIFFSMLFALAFIDLKLSVITINSCKQKTELLFTLKTAYMSRLLLFGPFFCFILLSQFILTEYLGSFEALIISLGNYYPKIEFSSLWRFVVGPIFHGDFNHWLINAVLTTLFSAMVPTNSKKKLFLIFVFGAVGSHIFTFIIHQLFSTPFDALVGASGGVYALLAYAIAYYCVRKHLYVVTSLLMLTIFIEYSVDIISSDISHAAHFSGLLIGLVASIAKPRHR